jgi:hypothetical protein
VITGWLVKVVLVLVLFGFAVFETGSPWIARVQLDSVAHDAADEAELALTRGADEPTAKAAAEAITRDHNDTLDSFTIDEQGNTHVTVKREAKSILVHKFFRSYYQVKSSAKGTRKGQ